MSCLRKSRIDTKLMKAFDKVSHDLTINRWWICESLSLIWYSLITRKSLSSNQRWHIYRLTKLETEKVLQINSYKQTTIKNLWEFRTTFKRRMVLEAIYSEEKNYPLISVSHIPLSLRNACCCAGILQRRVLNAFFPITIQHTSTIVARWWWQPPESWWFLCAWKPRLFFNTHTVCYRNKGK